MKSGAFFGMHTSYCFVCFGLSQHVLTASVRSTTSQPVCDLAPLQWIELGLMIEGGSASDEVETSFDSIERPAAPNVTEA